MTDDLGPPLVTSLQCSLYFYFPSILHLHSVFLLIFYLFFLSFTLTSISHYQILLLALHRSFLSMYAPITSVYSHFYPSPCLDRH